jgi:hypothetical protein
MKQLTTVGQRKKKCPKYSCVVLWNRKVLVPVPVPVPVPDPDIFSTVFQLQKLYLFNARSSIVSHKVYIYVYFIFRLLRQNVASHNVYVTKCNCI